MRIRLVAGRRILASLVLTFTLYAGNMDMVHADSGQIPPLKSYATADSYADSTTPTTFATLSIMWDLPTTWNGRTAQDDGGVLNFLGLELGAHNALTVLPDVGSARVWTIPGMAGDVWKVARGEYAILIRSGWHTPPVGFPFTEELLGLTLPAATMSMVWQYHGRLGTDPDVAKGDGTACGVVLTWHERHISLRRLPNPHPGAFGYVPLALYAGTNTCR